MLIRFRRIAITIFHPEIRTHFDYAACILVVEVEDPKEFTGRDFQEENFIAYFNDTHDQCFLTTWLCERTVGTRSRPTPEE